MIQLTKPFTDQHGTTHPAAVVVVTHINYSANQQQQVQANIQQGVVTYTANAQNAVESKHLHFQAVIYKDIQALQQGFEPITLRSNTYMTGFHIPQVDAASVETYVALCEQWLLDNVLVSEKQ